ncbi:MAG: CDP-diacylglycerol--serine O-phosphatidyltransferase, partial [Telluria sp.]
LHGALVLLLMVGVGALMVSTVRFPSSKQKMSKPMMVMIAVGLALLAWLQMKFFVLFFLIYISFTLLLNIGWRAGWRGIAPPRVYRDED